VDDIAGGVVRAVAHEGGGVADGTDSTHGEVSFAVCVCVCVRRERESAARCRLLCVCVCVCV